jgi:hypothetical protein
MKKVLKSITIAFNAMLLATVLFKLGENVLLVGTRALPSGDALFFFSLMLIAPAASLYTLYRSGNADEQSSQKSLLESSRFEDRRPLYEWIDTVEERLDAIEARETRAQQEER